MFTNLLALAGNKLSHPTSRNAQLIALMDDASSIASHNSQGAGLFGAPKRGPGRPRKISAEAPLEQDDKRLSEEVDFRQNEFGLVSLPAQNNPEHDVAEPLKWGDSTAVHRTERMMAKAGQYIDKKCGASFDWKVVDPATVNSTPALFASGPAFMMAFEFGVFQAVSAPRPRHYVDHQLVLGDLAFLVSAVNNEAHIAGAEFPTHYVDMQLVGHKGFSRMTHSADHEWMLHSTKIDNEEPVDHKTLERLSMFVHFVPVSFTVEYGRNKRKVMQTIFQIAQVLPLPGVDVLRCFEALVYRERPVLDITKECRVIWSRLSDHVLPRHERCMGPRPTDKEDGFVRRCFSELTVKANIIEQLERKWNALPPVCQRVVDVEVHGVPESGRFRWKSMDERVDGELVSIPPTLESSDFSEKERNFLQTFYCEQKRRAAWRMKVQHCVERRRETVKTAFPFIPRTWVYDCSLQQGIFDESGMHTYPQQHDEADLRLGHFEGCATVQLQKHCQKRLFDDKSLTREEFGILPFPDALSCHLHNTLTWMHQRIMLNDDEKDIALWTEEDIQSSYYSVALTDDGSGMVLPQQLTIPEPRMLAMLNHHSVRAYEKLRNLLVSSDFSEPAQTVQHVRNMSKWFSQIHPINVLTRMLTILPTFTGALGIRDTVHVLELCERQNEDDTQFLCKLLYDAHKKMSRDTGVLMQTSSSEMRALFVHQANKLGTARDIRPFNVHMIMELIFSQIGQYMGHNPNWTNMGWTNWVSDAGGRWPQERRSAQNTATFDCMWVKKANAAGIDSVVCAAWDCMCDLVSELVSIEKERNLHLKMVQCRRMTPAFARGLGKLEKSRTVTRQGDSKMIVQPPSAELLGVPLRATDIRDVQCEMMKALCDLNDRDKSSVNEVLGTTNLNSIGQRVATITVNLHIGRPIVYAHNMQVHCRTCVSEYKTLLQVMWMLPTAPPAARRMTLKRGRDEYDREPTSMQTEPRALHNDESSREMVGVLHLTSFLAGHIIAFSNLLGGIQYNIGHMHSIVKDFVLEIVTFKTAGFWAPGITSEHFSRTARCSVARKNYEATMYRLMQNLQRNKAVRHALVKSMATMQHNLLETYLMFDAMFQIMKQVIGRHTLVLMYVVGDMLEVPCVPFEWLLKWTQQANMDALLQRSAADRCLEEVVTAVPGQPSRIYVKAVQDNAAALCDAANVNVLRKWLYDCRFQNCFTGHTKTSHRYVMVSSPRNAMDENVVSEATRLDMEDDEDADRIRKHAFRVSFSGSIHDPKSKCMDMIAHNIKPYMQQHLTAFNFDSGELATELVKGALMDVESRTQNFSNFLFGCAGEGSVHFIRQFSSTQMLAPFGKHFSRQRMEDHHVAKLTHTHEYMPAENRSLTQASLSFNPMVLILFRSLIATSLRDISFPSGLPREVAWNYIPSTDELDADISELHIDHACRILMRELCHDIPRCALAPHGNHVNVRCIDRTTNHILAVPVQHNDSVSAHFFHRTRQQRTSNGTDLMSAAFPGVCPWLEDGMHCPQLLNMLYGHFWKALSNEKSPLTVMNLLPAFMPAQLPHIDYDLVVDQHYAVLQTGLNENQDDFALLVGYICRKNNKTVLHVGSFVNTGAFETVLESMQQQNCICLPTIHRPGALFKNGQGQYGIFKYIEKEASCYDWQTQKYNGIVKKRDQLCDAQLHPLEALHACLPILAPILVDKHIFKLCNPSLSNQIPNITGGAIKCYLWFPECADLVYENRVTVLVDVSKDHRTLCTVNLQGILNEGEEPTDNCIIHELMPVVQPTT